MKANNKQQNEQQLSRNDIGKVELLKGIKKHHVMEFAIIKKKRRETEEETLNCLNAEESSESNSGYFPRTTHLYKSDQETLEQISNEIKSNAKFTSSNVLHSSSDLGLTYKIKAEHQNGATLFFDGLYIRVTRIITTEVFNLDDLLSRTGVPQSESDVVNDFINSVQKNFPNENIYGHKFYDYYAIDETNWEELGLKRTGEAQLCLLVNDPNYFTITALIFSKMGKDFHVYLGEEERINQMIAHDFFIYKEIEMFMQFYDAKLKEVIALQSGLKANFGGVISPIWNIYNKHNMWNSVKEALRKLYSIKDLADKGKLLTKAIEKIIENKLAFFNGPRQIWINGEDVDHEEKIQHPMTHFFEVRLEDLKSKKIPNSASKPLYQEAFQRLEKKLTYLSSLEDEIYQRERDLLTAYQTEFSLYAVWFSLIAILIAVISLIYRGG